MVPGFQRVALRFKKWRGGGGGGKKITPPPPPLGAALYDQLPVPCLSNARAASRKRRATCRPKGSRLPSRSGSTGRAHAVTLMLRAPVATPKDRQLPQAHQNQLSHYRIATQPHAAPLRRSQQHWRSVCSTSPALQRLPPFFRAHRPNQRGQPPCWSPSHLLASSGRATKGLTKVLPGCTAGRVRAYR